MNFEIRHNHETLTYIRPGIEWYFMNDWVIDGKSYKVKTIIWTEEGCVYLNKKYEYRDFVVKRGEEDKMVEFILENEK